MTTELQSKNDSLVKTMAEGDKQKKSFSDQKSKLESQVKELTEQVKTRSDDNRNLEQRIRILESNLEKVESDKSGRKGSKPEGKVGDAGTKQSNDSYWSNWSRESSSGRNNIEASGLLASNSRALNGRTADQRIAAVSNNSNNLIVPGRNTTDKSHSDSDESNGFVNSGFTSEQIQANDDSLKRGLFFILGITVLGLIVVWLARI